MSSTAHRVSLAQIHLAVLLAGGTGLFAKLVTVSPAVMTCARTLFGCATLGAVAGLMRMSLRLPDGRTLAALAGSGVILAFHWFAFFQSIRISTVAMGVLGIGSFPLFVTFLEPLVFRERLRRSDLISGFLVVAGLVLVAPALDFRNQQTLGLLWGVVAGLAYAVFSLMSRSAVRTLPALTAAFYQQLFAGLACLPFTWAIWGRVSGHDWVYLVVLGVVFTGMSQWLFNLGLRHQSVQTLSVLLGLEPVYAIFLAWAILGEIPLARTLLGGAIICGAVVMTSLRPTRKG